ncbi:hypothetical protein NDU88_002309 [Pleurodeles waltl]|uniref:Uncharacterized protein n=1 Tax=Pleurodeles waltl TaxID=8319 RepID=A0AAV7TLE7_PLEWA|nr:hypothetical protein NDU88_002309 [Pleurodeles waltl]
MSTTPPSPSADLQQLPSAKPANVPVQYSGRRHQINPNQANPAPEDTGGSPRPESAGDQGTKARRRSPGAEPGAPQPSPDQHAKAASPAPQRKAASTARYTQPAHTGHAAQARGQPSRSTKEGGPRPESDRRRSPQSPLTTHCVPMGPQITPPAYSRATGRSSSPHHLSSDHLARPGPGGTPPLSPGHVSRARAGQILPGGVRGLITTAGGPPRKASSALPAPVRHEKPLQTARNRERQPSQPGRPTTTGPPKGRPALCRLTTGALARKKTAAGRDTTTNWNDPNTGGPPSAAMLGEIHV